MFPALEIIDLSFNGITQLPPLCLEKLTNLRHMDLSVGSCVRRVENLTAVHQGNEIAVIAGVSNLPKLQSLNMSRNRVKVIQIEGKQQF